MFNSINEGIVYFWNNTSLITKLLCLALIILFVIAGTYASMTGTWFLNPFVAATWKGAFLKARLIYGGVGFFTGAVSYILGYRLGKELFVCEED